MSGNDEKPYVPDGTKIKCGKCNAYINHDDYCDAGEACVWCCEECAEVYEEVDRRIW